MGGERRTAAALRRILDATGVSRRMLAEDAGLSRNSVDAWVNDRRRPRPGSLLQLAAGLDRRAERLRGLAEELRRLAQG